MKYRPRSRKCRAPKAASAQSVRPLASAPLCLLLISEGSDGANGGWIVATRAEMDAVADPKSFRGGLLRPCSAEFMLVDLSYN